MKQRVITGVLFALGIAVFIVPGYWFAWPPIVLFAGVAVLSSRELVQAARQRGLRPDPVMATAGSLLMLLPLLGSAYFARQNRGEEVGFTDQIAGGLALMAFLLLAAMLFTAIGILIRRGPEALPDAAATAAIMAYVAFPLSCPVILAFEVHDGYLWLLFGLVSPWISDTFAYFVGSAIGRHPIIPSLSPKKTLEGFLGGIVGTMLFIPLVFYLFGHTLGSDYRLTLYGIGFAMLSGIVLSLASQLGDWLASGIKRWCGVKDFGKLLPGHGGIMDRFDSAFFTLPMALALAVIYQVLRV